MPRDMNDSVDEHYARKERTKARKKQNRAKFDTRWADKLKQLGLIAHSEWHYSIVLTDGSCHYWPSTNKWRYCSNTQTGSAEHFYHFCHKRRLSK